jgi:hypothetical protein
VEEAARYVLEVLRNEKEPTETRLKAAAQVMDRGIGKPAQMIRVGGAVGMYDLSKLTEEQLRLGHEIARAASTGIGDTD